MKYIKPEITIQEIEVQLPMATSPEIGNGGEAPDVTTDTAPDAWDNIW